MSQSLLEKKLEKSFVSMLNGKEIFNVKGNSYGMKGFPDRLVFADRIYFVELKVGKALGAYYSQTPMQKFWQRKIEGSGGVYVLLTGPEEAKSFVDSLK